MTLLDLIIILAFFLLVVTGQIVIAPVTLAVLVGVLAVVRAIKGERV